MDLSGIEECQTRQQRQNKRGSPADSASRRTASDTGDTIGERAAGPIQPEILRRTAPGGPDAAALFVVSASSEMTANKKAG